MRKDLINAKEFKVGIKFTNENYYRTETYKTLEEAIAKFNDYKARGFDTIIRGV